MASQRKALLFLEAAFLQAPPAWHNRMLHLRRAAGKVRTCIASCPNRHGWTNIIVWSTQQGKPSPMGLTPQAAVSAITASRVEASLALGRTPNGVAHSSSVICWAISGIPMASFNAAIRLRTGPDPDRHIDLIQQTFAQRSMPFIWWVTKEDSEHGLEARLRRHGFDYYGDESIGMAIALSSQPDLTPGGESVSVARVVERRDTRTWFATLLESFAATPDELTKELATAVFSYLANDVLSGWHLYLAYMSERPVGTCALHLGSTAGLYSVGTVPVARRHGVGTALTKRALADASLAGHTIASLTASGLGAHL